MTAHPRRLLMDEPPLLVIPSLAAAIGLPDAIILQQLHYWLQQSRHVVEGQRWVYNTVADWHQQFPFWSERTIRTILARLEERGLVVTGSFNQRAFDRTKWYRLDYEAFALVENDANLRQIGQIHSAEVAECNRQELPDPFGESCRTNTRDYTETTPEKPPAGGRQPVTELSDADARWTRCVNAVRGMERVDAHEIVQHVRTVQRDAGMTIPDDVLLREMVRFRDHWNQKRETVALGQWKGWRNALTRWVTGIRPASTGSRTDPQLAGPRTPDPDLRRAVSGATWNPEAARGPRLGSQDRTVAARQPGAPGGAGSTEGTHDRDG